MTFDKICKRSDCKNSFIADNVRKKYCSDACRSIVKYRTYRDLYEGKGKNPYIKHCSICNTSFKAQKQRQKFCGVVCASKASKKFIDIPSSLEGASRKLDKRLGYVRVYCPSHPEANTWGYVYEHRVIAEQVIGRRLVENEIVHHKNGKRWDNRPENLEVMNKFDHGKLRGQREEDLNI